MPKDSRSPGWGHIVYAFLDRDGVINRKLPEGEYVARWEDFELLPGAVEAIAALKRSGRKVIVVTNQRGVALGRMTAAEVDGIHERLRARLADEGANIDAIYYCPHRLDACACRKPQTGMIEAGFRDFPGAGPENSIIIGDSLSDMECGRRAGMATLFIDPWIDPWTDSAHRSDAEAARQLADEVAGSLAEAVRLLLAVPVFSG